jgi:hypothetical protein
MFDPAPGGPPPGHVANSSCPSRSSRFSRSVRKAKAPRGAHRSCHPGRNTEAQATEAPLPFKIPLQFALIRVDSRLETLPIKNQNSTIVTRHSLRPSSPRPPSETPKLLFLRVFLRLNSLPTRIDAHRATLQPRSKSKLQPCPRSLKPLRPRLRSHPCSARPAESGYAALTI